MIIKHQLFNWLNYQLFVDTEKQSEHPEIIASSCFIYQELV